MKKLTLLALLTFCSSCKNPTTIIEQPSISDIEKTLETSKEQEDYLKSELQVITDLKIGIEKALSEKKPILLYFTGYALINGRKIEKNLLLENKKIFQTLKNNYINVWLYVDDRNDGEKWADYQRIEFNTNVQPYFVILDSNGNPMTEGIGYFKAKSDLESALLKHK